MFTDKISIAALVLAAALLSGCGEEPKPSAPPPAAPAAASTPAGDPLAPRYDATLAEGIAFNVDGYPKFLTEVSGMAALEDWGRWTEGPVAKFRFNQPLPNRFTLVLKAGAIGPNVGNPTTIRAGKVEEHVIVTDPVAKEYSVKFEGVDNADALEIIPPKPVRPKDINPGSTDTRLLGIGLAYLKIQ